MSTTPQGWARIGYTPVHTSKRLSDATRAAYAFIASQHVIPADFEADHAFGPYAGLCGEERVIAAYRHKKLVADPVPVCTHCGEVNHWRDTCTRMFN